MYNSARYNLPTYNQSSFPLVLVLSEAMVLVDVASYNVGDMTLTDSVKVQDWFFLRKTKGNNYSEWFN